MNLILSLIFLVIAIVSTKVFCHLAHGTRLMDMPNHRSMHSNPTVRGGGLVFISLCLISIPIITWVQAEFKAEFIIFALSISIVASLSFYDDLFQLSSLLRFLIQSVAAGIIVLCFYPSELNFLIVSIPYKMIIIPFIFIALLWSINLFNFMDGIDGYCATQSICILIVYLLLFNNAGIEASFYQGFCAVLIAGLLGFLWFNFPPARLFMGDVGSATLGLISFSLALIAQAQFNIPILYWFLINGLFVTDATFTLIRRVMHKEKWSQPHRTHAYQRLRQLGYKVPTILAGQIVLNVAFGILVLFLIHQLIAPFLAVGIEIALILTLYVIIEKKSPMFFQSNQQN